MIRELFVAAAITGAAVGLARLPLPTPAITTATCRA